MDSVYVFGFQVMKKILELLPAEPSFRKITLDFECAMWGALRDVFPDAELMGCVFHWNQALWRKVR